MNKEVDIVEISNTISHINNILSEIHNVVCDDKKGDIVTNNDDVYINNQTIINQKYFYSMLIFITSNEFNKEGIELLMLIFDVLNFDYRIKVDTKIYINELNDYLIENHSNKKFINKYISYMNNKFTDENEVIIYAKVFK